LDIRGIRESRSDKIFTIINNLCLILISLSILYPLVYIVSASLSTPDAVISGRVWLWPVGFSLEGYKAVFRHDLIMAGFMNSLFYMVFGTALNVFMTILAAYPLSRRDIFGGGFLMLLLVFTMLFDGGLIPRYLLVKDLGLLNTRWALIIPTALTVWNVIITRTYFKVSIPHEMLEAAQIDGCNDFKFLVKIVIPLSLPIIAVISLFYAVGHWNQFFNALIFLSDQKLFPLQLVLNHILIQNQVSLEMMDADEMVKKEALVQLLKYSLIVIASAPVLAIYPFVQKYFVKGVMLGSLKE
jgi:putative aldouronate transport system permease protein